MSESFNSDGSEKIAGRILNLFNCCDSKVKANELHKIYGEIEKFRGKPIIVHKHFV